MKRTRILTNFDIDSNISATEAYILKRDILVIALFAIFLSNSE